MADIHSDANTVTTGTVVYNHCEVCGHQNAWKRPMVSVDALNEERRLRAEVEAIAHHAMSILKSIQRQKLPLLAHVAAAIRLYPEWGQDATE